MRIPIKNKLVCLFFTALLVFSLSVTAYAATISEVEDGAFRIGNDIFSPTSPGFTLENVIKSMENGSDVYYRFNGQWFLISNLNSLDDLFNPAKYVPQEEVNSWGSGVWYQAGSETPVELEGNTVSGTYTISDVVAGISQGFAVSVNGLDDAKYFNVFANDVAIGAPVGIDAQIVGLSMLFTQPDKLEVKFYSDADGNNIVATATLNDNGSLVITVAGNDEVLEVISIE